jgi:hypothetical protein
LQRPIVQVHKVLKDRRLLAEQTAQQRHCCQRPLPTRAEVLVIAAIQVINCVVCLVFVRQWRRSPCVAAFRGC